MIHFLERDLAGDRDFFFFFCKHYFSKKKMEKKNSAHKKILNSVLQLIAVGHMPKMRQTDRKKIKKGLTLGIGLCSEPFNLLKPDVQ